MPLTDQQGEAATRIADNLCVIAGAGTGKTRVLVERYLHLLESGKLWPEDIAAITFTEKAAAEMTSKIRAACTLRAEQAADAAGRRAWIDRRDRLEAGVIDTIHGFCGRLVRQYPVEAAVDPHYAVVADADQRQLLADSIHATIRRLLDEDNADLLRVARAYGLGTMVRMLTRAAGRRADVLRAAATLDRPVEEMVEELGREVDHVAGVAIDDLLRNCRRQAGRIGATRGAEGDRIEIARQQAAEAMEMMGLTMPLATRLDGLRALDGIDLRGGSKKSWSSPELLAEMREAIGTLRDAAREALAACDLTDPADWPEEIELARSVLRAALAAIDDYRRAKVERSVLDYDDLLLGARDLLRDHGDVRRACGQRFRQVLVDELQDTDELQIEIIQLLLGEAATGFSPRPGTFFGVGDPKQSIYRFRGAEVAVFRRVAETLKPCGVVPLSRTFRFHRGLAGVTQAVFAPLLGSDFAALDAERPDTPPVSMEILLAACDDDLSADERRFREAARMARRIRRLADEEGVPFGQVAILMHRQTQSYPYEEALARLGIPCYVVGGRRFYEQEEIRDVVTALRVLRNPGDELSLAALLRGPLFGLSDDALYLLCRQGRLPEKLRDPAARERLWPQDAEKAARAEGWLRHFAGRAGRVPVARLVEEVVFDGPPAAGGQAQGGLAHVLLPGFLGERRYANLRRLLDKARRADLAGRSRLEDFLETVEAGVDEAVEEAEAALTAEVADTVRMMTVHKAKGLEFPYVLLANTDAGRTARRECLYNSPTLGLAPCRPDRRRGARDAAAYTLLRAQDAGQETEEFKRLFYVAATRAQERLIVSGSQTIGAGSWLAWLGESLGMDLAAESEGCRTVTVAPGAHVLVDVARNEPIPLAPRRATGEVARLFADGDLDREAFRKLAARKLPAALRQTAIDATAEVPLDRTQLALPVTALTDYDRCPALFYFHHVLGLREPPTEPVGNRHPSSLAGIPAAAFGDVVHAYLRRADFSAQRSDRPTLDRLAAQHADIAPDRRSEASEAAEHIINNFLSTPLAAEITKSPEVLREVSFVLLRQGFTLSGTIDLLYRDKAGQWVVVDYKTDHVEPDAVERCAAGYRTQLSVYVEAAREFSGTVVKSACLAFLAAGKIWYMNTPLLGGELEAMLDGIRLGRFEPRADCEENCACRPFCERTVTPQSFG